MADRRFALILINVFSALALILASIGIYGVISYSVAERTREIGIRMALGASQQQVLGMIVGAAPGWQSLVSASARRGLWG